MTGTARSVLLVLLALVAICSGLVWWLVKHPELSQLLPGQPSPQAKSEAKSEAKSAVAPATPAEKSASQSIKSATEALKDLGGQLGAPKPAPSEPGPQFDVARIEPNGDSVIAGRATPNATVELLIDDKVHDKTVADSTGAFVFVPKPLPPGKFALKLRATEPGGRQMVSSNSVAVELDPAAQEKAVATLSQKAPLAEAPAKAAAAPEKPVATLSKPAPAAEANIRVDLVEAQDGGKLSIAGRSTPGSTVRLYLNDAFVATGTASQDGQISFHIGGGVKPGEYRIRLDQIGATDKVTSRAEVPFSAPATLAARTPAAPTAPASSTPQTPVAAAEPKQAVPAPAASTPAAPTVVAEATHTPQAATGTPVRAGEPTPKPAPAATPTRETASAVAGPSPSAQPPATQPLPSREAAAQDNRQDNRQALPNPPESAAGKPEAPAPRAMAAANDRGSTVVVPSIDTKVVVRGDNLWQISRTTYGHGIRYTVIYSANRNQIRDPDLIYPGQIFVLPKVR